MQFHVVSTKMFVGTGQGLPWGDLGVREKVQPTSYTLSPEQRQSSLCRGQDHALMTFTELTDDCEMSEKAAWPSVYSPLSNSHVPCFPTEPM